MKTLIKRLTYAISATALGVSISIATVQAEVITVAPSNMACSDVENILPDTWPQDMKTLFQVEAANEYGVAVTGRGGNFDMMCGGREIFANNNMENLTAAGNGSEVDITPEYIQVDLVGDAMNQEDIDLSVQGDTVIIYFTADDNTDATDTRARRRYRARLRFRGNTRSR